MRYVKSRSSRADQRKSSSLHRFKISRPTLSLEKQTITYVVDYSREAVAQILDCLVKNSIVLTRLAPGTGTTSTFSILMTLVDDRQGGR